MTTTDPLALLQSKSVEQRAEATRYYERHGDLSDLEVLLDCAQNDSSVAIRNNAADAISDILSRYRTGENKSKLSVEERLNWMNRFRKLSPNKSPVVYLMYAALGIPEVLPIITAAFFDPRTELRISAAIGLKCYCLSADLLGNVKIEEQVVSLLSNPRLDGDAMAHIARVCAESGYVSALPVLQNLTGEGLIGETIRAATEQLKKASLRPVGIWVSDGLDSVEFNPETKVETCFAIISQKQAVLKKQDQWQLIDDFSSAEQRQLLFRRLAQPTPGPALQFADSTWYFANAKEVEGLLQKELNLTGKRNESLEVLGDVLQNRAVDNTKMWRNIAVLYLRAGALNKANNAAERAIELKRPPRDVYFIKAEVLRLSGNKSAAQELYKQCIAGARSEKSVLAQLCKERLEKEK